MKACSASGVMPLPRVRSFSFVGILHGITPHDGLYRLGKHFPAGIEVFGDAGSVELQLADTLEARLVGNDAVGEAQPRLAGRWSRSDRAASGNRQLAGQVLNSALAMPRFPSEFSKSIGLTLCGMVEEPISPATVFCLKQPREM